MNTLPRVKRVSILLSFLLMTQCIWPPTAVGSPQVAEDSAATNQADAPSLDAQLQTETPQDLTETQAYKLLYENAIESQNRLIATVRWAVGIVITIVIAVIGAQIFFNYRISKQEIKELKSEVEQSQRNRFNEFTEEQNSKIESVEREIDRKIGEFRDRQDERFSNLNRLVDLRIDQESNIVDRLQDRLKRDHNRLKAEIGRNSARLWRLEDVPSNALVSYIEAAQILQAQGRNLEYILDDISDLITDMDSALDTTIKDAERFLSQLPEDYSDRASRIKQQLEGLDSYSSRGYRSAFEISNPLYRYMDSDDKS